MTSTSMMPAAGQGGGSKTLTQALKPDTKKTQTRSSTGGGGGKVSKKKQVKNAAQLLDEFREQVQKQYDKQVGLENAKDVPAESAPLTTSQRDKLVIGNLLNDIDWNAFLARDRASMRRAAAASSLRSQTNVSNMDAALSLLDSEDYKAKRKEIIQKAAAYALEQQASFVASKIPESDLPFGAFQAYYPNGRVDQINQTRQNIEFRRLKKQQQDAKKQDPQVIDLQNKRFVDKVKGRMDGEIDPDKMAAQLEKFYSSVSQPGLKKLVRTIQDHTAMAAYPSDLARKIEKVLYQLPPGQRFYVSKYMAAILALRNDSFALQNGGFNAGAELNEALKAADPAKITYLIDILNDPASLNQQLRGDYKKKVQLQQDSNQIFGQMKARMNSSTMKYPLNIKSDVLMSFPNWAGAEGEKLHQKTIMLNQIQNRAKNLADVKDPYYTMIAKNSPHLAKYDSVLGKWVGKGVDQAAQKYKSLVANVSKRHSTTSHLLATRLTPQQVKKQIPPMIAQLVEANDAINTSGFGPISTNPNMSQLYVGRWEDDATGHMRLLPTATQKFISPISAPQNVAFRQARQLNLWNQIQSQQDAIQKITSDSLWQQKQIQRLAKGLRYGSQLQKTLNKQLHGLQNWYLNGHMNFTWKGLIYDSCDENRLSDWYAKALGSPQDPGIKQVQQNTANMSEAQVEQNEKKLTINKGLQQRYINIISNGFQIAQKRLAEQHGFDWDKEASTEPQYLKQLTQLQSAFRSLTSSGNAALATTLKKITKAVMIPESTSMDDIIKAQQKYQQRVQQIQGWKSSAAQNYQGDQNQLLRKFQSMNDALKTKNNKTAVSATLDNILDQFKIETYDMMKDTNKQALKPQAVLRRLNRNSSMYNALKST